MYIAPELLQALPSTSCDIFSLGLVLYELAAQLDLPTEAPSGSEAWHRLREGELPFPPAPECSAALKVRAPLGFARIADLRRATAHRVSPSPLCLFFAHRSLCDAAVHPTRRSARAHAR